MTTPRQRTSARTTPDRAAPVDGQRGDRRPALAGIAVGALGAVAVACAPLVTVVSSDAPIGGAAGAGAVVSALCALAVPVLASIALIARRPAAAGALIAAAGAVAAGMLMSDAQLFIGAIDANRLELFRPLSAAALTPSLGSGLVAAGHAFGAVGGILGVVAVARASLRDGYGGSGDVRSVASRIGAPAATLAAAASVVAAFALFAAQASSTDPVFLVPTVVAGPVALAVSAGVLAVVAVAVTAAALASVSAESASGALVGVSVAALGVVGTRWVSAATTGDRIEPGVGAVVGTLAAVVLLVVGVAGPVLARRTGDTDEHSADATRSTESGKSSKSAKAGKSARARLAAQATAVVRTRSRRRHRYAGIVGVCAGVALALGGILPLLSVPDSLPEPTVLGARLTVFAAIVLILLSVSMVLSVFGASVRPALGVYCVAAIMASTSVLQALVLALGLPGVEVGAGAVAVAVGVVLTVTTGALVLLAGSTEREDVDTSEVQSAPRIAVGVGAAGAVLSVVALGLPLYGSDASTAPTFAEFPWGWDSWGQAVFGAAVVVTAVVAPRSRPRRGAVLLAGAAIGMAIYVAGWPLAPVRGASVSMGSGAVVGIAATVILATAALLPRPTGQ